MGEIIAQTGILKEPNYLYYVSFDKDGYCLLCKALLKRGGKKKQQV